MKYLFVGFIVLALLSTVLLPGCKKDEATAAPVSFVDGYTVNLTDPTGTAYSGDFFPITPGYGCYYSGHANVHTSETTPGNPTTSDSVDSPAYGSLQVLHPVSIVLQSGTYQLYPVIDASNMAGTYSTDTSRFFMKDTQAVYVKALKLSDGSYLEVTNPLFLKSRLVVGDSWETAPQMNMADIFASEAGVIASGSNLTMNARSKFFVVGKETISLPIGMRSAVRMEQANDVSMSGTMSFTDPGYGTIVVNINMTAQLAIVYHLIADTGIVHQNTKGPMNITISAQGQTATMTATIDEVDLRLEYLTGSPIISKHATSVKQLPKFHTRLEQRMWQISQAIAKVVTKKLTIQ